MARLSTTPTSKGWRRLPPTAPPHPAAARARDRVIPFHEFSPLRCGRGTQDSIQAAASVYEVEQLQTNPQLLRAKTEELLKERGACR